jgi:hypothetical protein
MLGYCQKRYFGRLHLSHYSRRERKWMVHNERHGKDMMKSQDFREDLKIR